MGAAVRAAAVVLRLEAVPVALATRAGRFEAVALQPANGAVAARAAQAHPAAPTAARRGWGALPGEVAVLRPADVPAALVRRAGRHGVTKPRSVAVVLVPVGVVVRAAVRVLRLGMSGLPPGADVLHVEDVPVALVMRARRLGVAEPRPGAVVPVPGGGVVRAAVRAFRPVAVVPMAVRRRWAVIPRWVCGLRLEAVPVVPVMRARRLRSAVSRPWDGQVALVACADRLGVAALRPGALRRVLVLRLGGVRVALVPRAGRLGSVASWTGSRCLGAGLSLALVAGPGRHGLRPGTGVPRLWERLVRPAAPRQAVPRPRVLQWWAGRATVGFVPRRRGALSGRAARPRRWKGCPRSAAGTGTGRTRRAACPRGGGARCQGGSG